jgi:hypothetical protein
MMSVAWCHSQRSDEFLIMWQAQRTKDRPEMFESLALCFALPYSASLNMTNRAGDPGGPYR